MTTNINDECDGGSDEALPRTYLPLIAFSSPSSSLQAYLVLFLLSGFSPPSTVSCSRPWSSSPSSSHAFWLCHVAVFLVFVLVCIVIAILLVCVTRCSSWYACSSASPSLYVLSSTMYGPSLQSPMHVSCNCLVCVHHLRRPSSFHDTVTAAGYVSHLWCRLKEAQRVTLISSVLPIHLRRHSMMLQLVPSLSSSLELP